MVDPQQLREKIAKELELAFHSEPWPGHGVDASDCNMCRIARDALLPLVLEEKREAWTEGESSTTSSNPADFVNPYLNTDNEANCPTCGAPDPSLHPKVGAYGWDKCGDDFHSRVNPYLPQPTEGASDARTA